MGVRLERIYKRADWPPPGITYESTFVNLWKIKHPTLRASRLKVTYKDIFSNERRFRFRLTDSPMCEICGQVETVEHPLFLCQNAVKWWAFYHRITRARVSSLFEVLCCTTDVGLEVIKSIIIRSLIQINRSRNKSEREIVMECLFYLGIELRLKGGKSVKLQQWANTLRNL